MSLVYFSVVKKVLTTQLLTRIATGSYTIFRKENWFCPFAKHCECTVFIGMFSTQYSPVLQRFSPKTNELSLALIFGYLRHKAN